MKIRNKFSNSRIQLTLLTQQIDYNRRAMTLSEHVYSTLKRRGKKKRSYLEHNKLFLNNRIEITSLSDCNKTRKYSANSLTVGDKGSKFCSVAQRTLNTPLRTVDVNAYKSSPVQSVL